MDKNIRRETRKYRAGLKKAGIDVIEARIKKLRDSSYIVSFSFKHNNSVMRGGVVTGGVLSELRPLGKLVNIALIRQIEWYGRLKSNTSELL